MKARDVGLDWWLQTYSRDEDGVEYNLASGYVTQITRVNGMIRLTFTPAEGEFHSIIVFDNADSGDDWDALEPDNYARYTFRSLAAMPGNFEQGGQA